MSLAFGLSACGGDSSKSDFIAKADKACREFDKKAQALQRPNSIDDLDRYAGEAGALSKQTRDRLKGIGPPAGLEDEYDNFLEQGEKGIEEIDKLRKAAQQKNEPEIGAIIARIDKLDKAQSASARKIGFKHCGGG